MGAWGTGNFENDDAADFLRDLRAQRVNDIKELFSSIESQIGYLEAPESSVAIAAAEVLAAAKGAPTPEVPSAITDWIEQNKPAVMPELVGSALRAVRRIKADSELQALWDEGSQGAEWHRRIDDLIKRLSN